MKAKTLWILFAGGTLLAASCRHYSRNHMQMDDGVNRVEVSYNGEIEFNDDETAIASISRGGYVDCWRNEDHLIAGRTNNGVLLTELYENKKPVDTASAEGKAIVARVIKAMIGMGFDIEGRMGRLYRRGGYAALLRGVDSVDGDYARGRYLERILGGDSLSSGIIASVITRVRDRVGGDYDKGRLLEMVDTGYLKNDSVGVGYLAVVRSMNGDYEKSQALQHFLRGPVPVQRYTSVLDAAGTIKGDYERSNVLRRLIEQPLPEGKPFDSLLAVVGKMGGDYEKSNLLKEIVQKNVKEGGSWAGLIRTTATLGGEYERSNVLVEIGQRLPKTDSLRVLYMNAAKTVHSDVDYGRVVKAVER